MPLASPPVVVEPRTRGGDYFHEPDLTYFRTLINHRC
jgi:hypothetical protein